MKNVFDRLIMIAFGIALIVVLYLNALSGRYERMADYVVIDKWKPVVYVIPATDIPYIVNDTIITKYEPYNYNNQSTD